MKLTSATQPVMGETAASMSKKTNKPPEAYKEFEAVFLQSFVEAILPDNASSVFGKGLAGDTWKSFFAEKIAHEVAQSGQIGIAEQLANTSVAVPHKLL